MDGGVKCGKPGVDSQIRYPCYCKLNIHMVNVFLPLLNIRFVPNS